MIKFCVDDSFTIDRQRHYEKQIEFLAIFPSFCCNINSKVIWKVKREIFFIENPFIFLTFNDALWFRMVGLFLKFDFGLFDSRFNRNVITTERHGT